MTDYRIEFAITRRCEGEEDFTEIGFGSSGEHDNLDACNYAIDSMVSHGQWETESGQRSARDRRVAAEALRAASDDIKARIVMFRRLDAHPEYMNALNDAWGLVKNRERAADRIEAQG
jgi:hypothetical protein